MAFFGRNTVLADLRLHKHQAGLVTSGTLTTFGTGSTSVSYANVCVWPVHEISGMGMEQAAHQQTTITAWRIGETTAPRADDIWTVNSNVYAVIDVTARHNHDEASNYAIYDCTCTRKG